MDAARAAISLALRADRTLIPAMTADAIYLLF
ncbi:Hypotetical protein [Gulosibacter molinativorax]|nr:Hypotetical protein [Gulosibacter molinativorax]